MNKHNEHTKRTSYMIRKDEQTKRNSKLLNPNSKWTTQWTHNAKQTQNKMQCNEQIKEHKTK